MPLLLGLCKYFFKKVFFFDFTLRPYRWVLFKGRTLYVGCWNKKNPKNRLTIQL